MPTLNEKKLSKKADIVHELPYIALAAIVILASAYMIFKLANVSLVDEDLQASKNNLGVLASKIQSLVDDPNNFTSTEFAYYLADNYYVVGFEKDWEAELKSNIGFYKKDYGDWQSMKIEKPASCADYCICLFNTDWEEFKAGSPQELKQPPIICRNFYKEIRFLMPQKQGWADGSKEWEIYGGKEENYRKNYAALYDQGAATVIKNLAQYVGAQATTETPYAYFILDGLFSGTGHFGTQNIYVEKYVNTDGKINIFVSGTNSYTDNRKKAMYDNFAKKPEAQLLAEIDAGPPTNTIESGEKFLKSYPESAKVPYVLLKLGEAYIAIKNPDKAIEQYNEIIASYGGSEYVDDAYYGLGSLYNGKEQHDQALVYFKKVESGELKDDATVGTGFSYVGKKEYEKALDIFQHTGVDSQLLDDVLYGSALTYYGMGKKTEAIENLNNLLSIYPDTEHRFNAVALLDKISQEQT